MGTRTVSRPSWMVRVVSSYTTVTTLVQVLLDVYPCVAIVVGVEEGRITCGDIYCLCMFDSRRTCPRTYIAARDPTDTDCPIPTPTSTMSIPPTIKLPQLSIPHQNSGLKGRNRSGSIVKVEEVGGRVEELLDRSAYLNINANWVNAKGVCIRTVQFF